MLSLTLIVSSFWKSRTVNSTTVIASVKFYETYNLALRLLQRDPNGVHFLYGSDFRRRGFATGGLEVVMPLIW